MVRYTARVDGVPSHLTFLPTPQLIPTIIQLQEIAILSVNPTKQLDF